MEILFLVPFALLWGILQEARHLALIHLPDDGEPPPIGHVPGDDSWARDVEIFERMLARPAGKHGIL